MPKSHPNRHPTRPKATRTHPGGFQWGRRSRRLLGWEFRPRNFMKNRIAGHRLVSPRFRLLGGLLFPMGCGGFSTLPVKTT